MSSTKGQHPAQKRYPPEIKERAVRMVHELRREDPADQGRDCPGRAPAGHRERVAPEKTASTAMIRVVHRLRGFQLWFDDCTFSSC